jgi:hypothetical protein
VECHKEFCRLFSECKGFKSGLLSILSLLSSEIFSQSLKRYPCEDVLCIFQSGYNNSRFLIVPDWYTNGYCHVLELVQTHKSISGIAPDYRCSKFVDRSCVSSNSSRENIYTRKNAEGVTGL